MVRNGIKSSSVTVKIFDISDDVETSIPPVPASAILIMAVGALTSEGFVTRFEG